MALLTSFSRSIGQPGCVLQRFGAGNGSSPGTHQPTSKSSRIGACRSSWSPLKSKRAVLISKGDKEVCKRDKEQVPEQRSFSRRALLGLMFAGAGISLLGAQEANGIELDAIEERLLTSSRQADANQDGFGFDGLGGDADEYAPGELVGVAQSGQGAILYVEVDGYEEPMKLGVGPVEAMAVVTAAQGKANRRPVTHEAWITTLAAVGWKVERVMIPRLVHNVFYGRVVLSHPSATTGRTALVGGQQSLDPEASKLTSVDLRPSDAIALAMRCHAPLFVSRQVVDEITFEDHLAEALMSHASQKPEPEPPIKPCVTLEEMTSGQFKA